MIIGENDNNNDDLSMIFIYNHRFISSFKLPHVWALLELHIQQVSSEFTNDLLTLKVKNKV